MTELKNKSLKLSLSEVIYALVFITGILGSYFLLQYKVDKLDEGKIENRIRIEKLEERVRLQEIQISRINEKLDIIGNDVSVIKNAVLDATFNPKR
jgi:hypothetical protein